MAMYPTRLGQLTLLDWMKLVAALTIVVIEAVTRLILLFVPSPVVTFMDNHIVSFCKRVSRFSGP